MEQLTDCSYLYSESFLENNKNYHQMPVKYIRTVNMITETNTHSARYKINKPEKFYKQGFCNIRATHQNLIEKIEFYIGEKIITSVLNPDGKLLPCLRTIVNINNDTVVPFLTTEKFIPYFTNYNAEINIYFKDDAEIIEINKVVLTYDEIEMRDKQNLFAPVQDGFSNEKWKNIEEENFPLIEYKTPTMMYNIIPFYQQQIKYHLKIIRNTNYLLLYSPGNTIKKCHLSLSENKSTMVFPLEKEILENPEMNLFKLPVEICSRVVPACTATSSSTADCVSINRHATTGPINKQPSYNYNEIPLVLEVETNEKIVNEQILYIFTLGSSIFRILPGELHEMH